MRYNIVRNGKDCLPKHCKQSRKYRAMMRRRGKDGANRGTCVMRLNGKKEGVR